MESTDVFSAFAKLSKILVEGSGDLKGEQFLGVKSKTFVYFHQIKLKYW